MTDDHPQLDSELIAQIIRPTIGDNPSTKVKAIINTIHVRFEKCISYKKVWMGKQKVIASI
ncbi:hypothetical protein, partial [Klebsiella pneumoniae]|uniref:hypothetical protein n=1 Tax=Klebsiella pneumoniae TaxID=573 RepID=UPI001D0E25CF